MQKETEKLPGLFLERFRRIFSAGEAEDCLVFLETAKPVSFRVNLLKKSCEEIDQSLAQHGFHLEEVPWCREARILREGGLRALQETGIYRNGEIYIQSLSSMIPPLVLNPQPGETILDLAAAPGSKTTQMAVMMKGQGKIIANDNHRGRFFRLKANVDQQGAVNVELSLRYGETFGRQRPEHYDRVLLDAPCSSEGRFLVDDPDSYRYWKIAKVEEMVRKQKKLLYSALHALRPGGSLVYSTCTFAPEENEGVLDWVLKKFEGLICLEKIELPLKNQMPGMTGWEGKPFHPDVRQAVRIVPTRDMEGFFAGKIRKLESFPVKATA